MIKTNIKKVVLEKVPASEVSQLLYDFLIDKATQIAVFSEYGDNHTITSFSIHATIEEMVETVPNDAISQVAAVLVGTGLIP
jgi:hypothetical protein